MVIVAAYDAIQNVSSLACRPLLNSENRLIHQQAYKTETENDSQMALYFRKNEAFILVAFLWGPGLLGEGTYPVRSSPKSLAAAGGG